MPTGVVVLWPESHPWADADWVRRTIHQGINMVAGKLTNPQVPVVYLNVRADLPGDGHLGEGWNHWPVGAPYYGEIRLDWQEVFVGGWDTLYTIAHEVGHAVCGVHWHNPDPADLLYPYSRTVANPWDGTFTRNDRLAFRVMGWEVTA